MSEASSSGEKLTFLGSLLKRQVPQILATYAGVCWGVVQFTDWLTGRYQLSPSLTDFVAYLAVLATPSVLLLAWFRGEPGKTPWTRWEKVGLPLNLLLAALVLWLAFQGSELGSINQTVTVTDASGRTVQRQVPKSAFRKRIALFFFENESGDPKVDWLRQGVTFALSTDLGQDLYLDLRDGYGMAERINRASFSYRDDLRLGFEREVANYYRKPYFVTGTYARSPGGYTLQVDLYETQRAKRLSRRRYQGTNLFELIDNASLQLKRDLGVPEVHIEDTIDMPVAEVLTHSTAALEAFVHGMNASRFDRNRPGAAPFFGQAVALDSSFGYGYLMQVETFLNSAQNSRAKAALQQAKRFAFELDVNAQIFLDSIGYLFIDGKADKALAVLKQGVALYPDSLDAHERLASFYENNGQTGEAIAEYSRMLELDPEQYTYLASIGDLYRKRGAFQDALTQYRRYADQRPDQARPYNGSADTYLAMGDFGQAEAFYRKALSVDAGNNDALLGIAQIVLYRGEPAEAENQAREALRLSTLPSERTNALSLVEDIYHLEGRWREALANQPALLAEVKKSNSEFGLVLNQMARLENYVQAGRGAEALAIVRSQQARARGVPLLEVALDVGLLHIHLANRNTEGTEPLIAHAQKLLKDVGLSGAASDLQLTWSRGRIAELRGQYRAAIDFYRQSLGEDATRQTTPIDIGRCYRKLGENENARAALTEALRLFPAHPEAHYELAQIQWAAGDLVSARKEIALALRVWAKADPGYDLPREARAFAGKLGRAGL